MRQPYDWDSDVWLVREERWRPERSDAASGFLPYAILMPVGIERDVYDDGGLLVRGRRIRLNEGGIVEARASSLLTTCLPYRLTAEQFASLVLQSHALHQQHDRLLRLSRMAGRLSERSGRALARSGVTNDREERHLKGSGSRMAPGRFFFKNGDDAAFHLGVFYDVDCAWLVEADLPARGASFRQARLGMGVKVDIDGATRADVPPWVVEMVGRVSEYHFVASSDLDAAIEIARSRIVALDQRRQASSRQDLEKHATARRRWSSELGLRAQRLAPRSILRWDLERVGARIEAMP